MRAPSKLTYAKNEVTDWPVPNYWDWLVLLLVVVILFLLGFAAHAMLGKFTIGETTAVSLAPKNLPYYALLTLLRMFVALLFAMLFTFTFATWAAKSRTAERFIIPMIDVLQSVPVLGFLSITVVGFIVLFRGSMLGPECAAIFAIFTAQAWNMALSFYQSLKMLPEDLREASAMLQLSAWQKFWRVEVPFATPGLVWNIMLSMSSSWIFLVAAEAISVANHVIYLPGVGSYIATAIIQQNKMAIVYVIFTMLIVIFLVDQLLFRPLVAWSEKFKLADVDNDNPPESWLLNLFQSTRFFRYLGDWFSDLMNALVNMRIFRLRTERLFAPTTNKNWLPFFSVLWNVVLIGLLIVAVVILGRYIMTGVSSAEIGDAAREGVFTAVRVLAAIVISSIIWVPIGVWIGMNARATQIAQPIAQFLAAFPMNLIFPIVVWAILHFSLNVNIWVSPLMVLGAQWYILFNVIAGTTSLPKNLHHAVRSLGVSGWLWWRKLILPGIFPFYITGAITAAGAAWNVSIIAEAVRWGHTQLWAEGLGAYIVKASNSGNFRELALGISFMSLYVLFFNRFVWRPLHRLAEQRYRLQ